MTFVPQVNNFNNPSEVWDSLKVCNRCPASKMCGPKIEMRSMRRKCEILFGHVEVHILLRAFKIYDRAHLRECFSMTEYFFYGILLLVRWSLKYLFNKQLYIVHA